MDLTTPQHHAEHFRGLHRERNPLILFNAWDVATGKTIAKASPAIATSSGAVAAALGYADGENVPLGAVVGLVTRSTAAFSVPVSIDLEAGYADSPHDAAASVTRILKAGAAGINIEDGLVGGKRVRSGRRRLCRSTSREAFQKSLISRG
jgi:2-methylisocitrate lyase-like PEP mutase family enzyme